MAARKELVLLLALALALAPSACHRARQASPDATAREVRFLLDSPPATLNPRQTADASGQRLGSLIFRALTVLDSHLVPRPDLSDHWEILDQGRSWRFTMRPELRDHAGAPITAERVRQCLENYRAGKPVSIQRAAFPSWKETRAEGNTVTLVLDAPDPYLPRNLSLLRYFTTDATTAPCSEPGPGTAVIASGDFKPDRWELAPESELTLLPMRAGLHPLKFFFSEDDNLKTLKLLAGEADAMQNSIAITKTVWIEKKYPERFRVLETEGVVVGYMSFNLRDPVLRDPRVRAAIAHAIDRDDIVRNKYAGFATVAGSLLSPLLPESRQVPFAFDPALSEKLLDESGHPRGRDGVRLRIRYKCTPIRDGLEMAQMFQQMLARVGVSLQIEVVEPAVFFASIRQGHFQMYSSRWLGVADASILYGTLRSGQPNNRVKYVDPEVDRLLDRAVTQVRLEDRLPALQRVQERMMEDLPYFPLWYWKNSLTLRSDLTGLEASDLSLSGALDPLVRLRFAP